MKLSLIAAALVAVSPGLIAAQTGQSTQSVGERTTVAGCVQRAQRNGSLGGTVVGTTAAPNTADDEANSSAMVNAFLLTDATRVVAGVADRPANTARADTGTPGTT